MNTRATWDDQESSLPTQSQLASSNAQVQHAPESLGLQERVQRDVVRALYAQTPQALVIGLIFGAVFVYAFYRRVGALAWWWYAAMLASQAWGLWALLDFRKQDRYRSAPVWSITHARRMFTLRAWSAGFLLGAMAWLFYHPSFGDARWLTVLCICGLAAGSITSYAYHLPTLYGFIFLLCAPMWARLVQLQVEIAAPGYWVGHALFLFYISMLSWFGLMQHRLLVGSIRMRHKNRDLLMETRQQALALEAANQAKARFFAAASHDLRQPLHAMGYYTGLLKPHAQDAPHVERIAQCVESLDGLLEGVLSISRLDAGKVERHLVPTDLKALLLRLLTLYEGVAQAKGLQMRLRLPATLRAGDAKAWGWTDPVLLERVMGNLLSNALRYTQRGGVLMALQGDASNWRLHVVDTGVGIAQEQLGTVFDEFVQLNNPQRDASQGVGLGLATVKRICALLEHPLQVVSRLHQGSRFTLRMPLATPPLVPTSSAANAAAQSLLRGHVLLVEDNDLVRESLLHSLQEWGLACTACTDAAQATQALAQQAFDVVLSDWRLPGPLRGDALLQQALSLASSPQAAPLCLLMTGETDDSLGHVDERITLLRKPVRPIRLRALLSAHLLRNSG
jgi:two-component system, sensor histidine kinase